MSVAIVTGSSGLVGSEACLQFAREGLDVVGIDNNMREYFFGASGNTSETSRLIRSSIKNYSELAIDIRDRPSIESVFKDYGADIAVVVHTAAQPSHDWAAREPHTDFGVNAVATLNLLEATRLHAKDAVVIFTSTNKVYGDLPNSLPLLELDTRWEMPSDHPFVDGINESMSIDQSTHSLFGVSKVAADLLVQEYARYFGLKTVCFRGGCLTGARHAGAELHGFLAHLVACTAGRKPYTVFGYKGKQVRDNIHSSDLVAAFIEWFRSPRAGEVYNIGGGRFSNCSMLEAITLAERVTGAHLDWSYSDSSRKGDHMWWISDTSKFESHYPNWRRQISLETIVAEMAEGFAERSKR